MHKSDRKIVATPHVTIFYKLTKPKLWRAGGGRGAGWAQMLK